MNDFVWQLIPTSSQKDRNSPIARTTDRAAVEGGWLVRETAITMTTVPVAASGGGPSILQIPSVAITFVPDPEHKWKTGS